MVRAERPRSTSRYSRNSVINLRKEEGIAHTLYATSRLTVKAVDDAPDGAAARMIGCSYLAMSASRLRTRFAAVLTVLLVGVGLFVSPQSGCIVTPRAGAYCAVEHFIPASHSVDTTLAVAETIRVAVVLPPQIRTTLSQARKETIRLPKPNMDLPPVKPWRDRHLPYAAAMRDA